ncbi:SCP2 sterol-binding domain-containing protein [Patulibacter defluvii]|uniref:SCP2 sterol-binding domain-containing protein n=1 Tax=Patulibacter defluvii TaxID=3095358 RepID=UPI002A75BDC6|nr:SCP2 sterol-binding domain-containing protein [Patulibacter sp. DM4]
MAFFKDADEVYQYIGGVFRQASEHPEAGPKLRASNVVMQVYYTDPDSSLTIRMSDPMEVVDGGDEPDADVKLWMPADIADKYWRGEYNLAVGLAKGKVKARGPVSKILKLVPVTKPLFPLYRDLVGEKDAAAA